jgi:hypothetical protein
MKHFAKCWGFLMRNLMKLGSRQSRASCFLKDDCREIDGDPELLHRAFECGVESPWMPCRRRDADLANL